MKIIRVDRLRAINYANNDIFIVNLTEISDFNKYRVAVGTVNPKVGPSHKINVRMNK